MFRTVSRSGVDLGEPPRLRCPCDLRYVSKRRPDRRGPGPTNLVLLCSFHHTALHNRGYRVRRLPDRWDVRRPDGTAIDGTGRPLAGDVESLIEMDTRAGLRITPTWSGEPLDPTPILDTLLPRARAA
jgi:hypothetical protein